MLLPVGIWFLAVVFGTYLGHGLFVQLRERRGRIRWYVWEPDEKRTYRNRAEAPVEYWVSMAIQSFLLTLCIYAAMHSV